MKVYVISEREVIEMAMKTFEKATLRLKFSQGLNEKGQVIEKTKTYQNISEQASLDDLAIVGTALASLFEYPFIGTSVATQEAIQN